MKAVRFSQVVARSGHPEVYTLWTTPELQNGKAVAAYQTLENALAAGAE